MNQFRGLRRETVEFGPRGARNRERSHRGSTRYSILGFPHSFFVLCEKLWMGSFWHWFLSYEHMVLSKNGKRYPDRINVAAMQHGLGDKRMMCAFASISLCEGIRRHFSVSWGGRLCWLARSGFVLILGSVLASSAELKWTSSGEGFRSAELQVARSDRPGFTLMDPKLTGLTFSNMLAQQRHLTNQILLNGSGVAAGDVDGDGWCDLYFCRLDGPNALYRNLGNWKFEDVTKTAGVACDSLDATGAALADLDGDGDLDLVVNSVGGGTRVFRNDGRGHFKEDAHALNPDKGGMSLALGDVDGDGFLDLYVANYRTSGLMDMPNTKFRLKVEQGKQVITAVNGRPVTEPDLVGRFSVNSRGGVDEHGEVDGFYRNIGGTNWVSVSFTGGAFLDEDGKVLPSPPYEWGLSVMMRDINQDGLPDIYVCNDFDAEDRIWLNQGAQKFRACPRLAQRKGSLFSMGVDFADINRDGFDDFLVLDMSSREHVQRMTQMGDRFGSMVRIGDIASRPQNMLNTLFLNRRDGTYAEIGYLSGLAASEWSWATAFVDVDLDGWEDVLVTNGHERAARHLDFVERLARMRAEKKLSGPEILQARTLFPRLDTANLAFRNRGDLTFEESGQRWGFDLRGVSQGLALADLDNDGDQDAVLNNLNGPVAVYRNDASAARLAVRLKGAAPNTKGIGARIKVFGGPVPMQSQEMICGGRYLSSDDPLRVFAAGSVTNELRIEVLWRSGKQSMVKAAKANHVYEIEESNAVVVPVVAQKPPVQPLFVDVSALIPHTHHKEAYDDFALQPLLPHRLSQAGPGITWWDTDGDGWDDLIIGSGKGGALSVYRNDRQGGFKAASGPPFNQILTRDQTTILGFKNRDGSRVLLAGSSNYEDGLTNGGVVRQYNLATQQVEDSFPGAESSTGPLAMTDLNGSGHLSLFVGGRVIPKRFPEAASSLLFTRTNDAWILDAENTKALANVGLVNGAVFSDLDGDGTADLVLACAWGPVRLFQNDKGRLKEITEQAGLSNYRGWWNGVCTGDFNGDGRPDIVACNWGRNTKYESVRGQPWRLNYGDLQGRGVVDTLESYYDPLTRTWVPWQPLRIAAVALPFLSQRWQTQEAYGRASFDEIYGDVLKNTKRLEVNWLETTLFLNLGDRFEARPLPLEAQMTPAFGACAGDVDGDGHEDLFLSQNFFGVPPEQSRYDAGCGLWLRGDGRGGVKALSGEESGVKVYGEQRGAALCDFDHDGRLDLAVGQNGAATKLFRNVRGRPGLRVRLAGPPGNPDALGAAMRAVTGKGLGSLGLGPLREVQAGSGHFSQNSFEQVFPSSPKPTALWIRWPEGKAIQIEIKETESELFIDPEGRKDRSR